jgi:hypothetical protein
MGLTKEPAEVNFTTISNIWAAKEEKEFSELIKKQKKVHNYRKQLKFLHYKLHSLWSLCLCGIFSPTKTQRPQSSRNYL